MRVEGSGVGNEVLKISGSVSVVVFSVVGTSGVVVSVVGKTMGVKSSAPIHSSLGTQ